MKKVIALILTAALIAVLAACSNANPKTQDIFKPGTYSATVQGHNAELTVETTFTKDRVSKITVTEHKESPGVGDTAMQTVANDIIAKQGFDVDIVSGATYSSYALLEAVSTAAKEAGANIEIIKMPAAPEPEAPNAAPGNFKPGTYTATAKGFGGEITVTIEVDATTILSVTAQGPDETAGIGSRAIEKLPELIKQANTAEVDSVSGATFSSEGVIEAAKKALADAAG